MPAATNAAAAPNAAMRMTDTFTRIVARERTKSGTCSNGADYISCALLQSPSRHHNGAAVTVEPDDWDAHWRQYDEATDQNPAALFRRRVIERALGSNTGVRRILDIGSGQGDLAASLAKRHPGAALLGLEYSQRGVD